MLPENTTTIEEFISAGSNASISYFNLSFLNKAQNGTYVTVLNAVSDYLDELKNAAINVKLSDEQQRTYFYKPKLLCQDIYGNPELYYIILLMNDMADVKEFTKPVIKMLRKDHMNSIIGYIYDAECSAMDNYNSKINESGN